MAGYPPEVARGIALVLTAHRQGLVDSDALGLVLTYYDNEGARDPAPASRVLERLGRLSAEQVRALEQSLASDSRAAARSGGRPAGRAFGDRFTIEAELGGGGMGVVYRARDLVLRRPVALKQIRADRCSDAALARFEREARIMARVRHPACVGIYDAGVQGGDPYLVMELVEGRSLAEVIREARGGLDPRRAAAWIRDVARGLHACHEAGIVHRDVKPPNVLVDARDRARVTDFGVARDQDAETRLTHSEAAVGTALYMAPEQLGSPEETDRRADVYGLGATLHEALTGAPPFSGHQLQVFRAILEEDPVPVTELRPEVPARLAAIVARCLRKRPEDRYATAEELARDLDLFLGAAEAAPAAPAGGPVRRRPVALAAGLALAAVAAGGGAVVASGGLGGAAPVEPAPGPAGAADPGPGATGVAALDSGAGAPTGHASAATSPAPAPPGPPDAAAGAPTLEVRQGELVNAKDGSVVVWAPPGTFLMGNPYPDLEGAEEREGPAHRVTLTEGFYLGKHEVTWDQYRAFCAATGREVPSHRIERDGVVFEAPGDHPVFRVTWFDARDYCAWAGGRLPTEAEWEYAARGDHESFYPWQPELDWRGGYASRGAFFPVDPVAANVDSERPPLVHDDGAPFTAPVGSYPAGASPFGCLDMAGNVREWVADWFGSYEAGAARDPRGPAGGAFRVIRGGSFAQGPFVSRSVTRNEGNPDSPSPSGRSSVGLRLCLPAKASRR